MRGLSFDLPICTERLRLRPLQLGDAEAIFGLFNNWTGDAVYCGATAQNIASLRVQEKLGFIRAGETMLHSKPRGGEFPHVNTVLTHARFHSLAEEQS
jgi:RimJ/RimL family protein N-acetyltransferase